MSNPAPFMAHMGPGRRTVQTPAQQSTQATGEPGPHDWALRFYNATQAARKAGYDAGEREGYERGVRWGHLCGACWAVMAMLLLGVLTGAIK